MLPLCVPGGCMCVCVCGGGGGARSRESIHPLVRQRTRPTVRPCPRNTQHIRTRGNLTVLVHACVRVCVCVCYAGGTCIRPSLGGPVAGRLCLLVPNDNYVIEDGYANRLYDASTTPAPAPAPPPVAVGSGDHPPGPPEPGGLPALHISTAPIPVCRRTNHRRVGAAGADDKWGVSRDMGGPPARGDRRGRQRGQTRPSPICRTRTRSGIAPTLTAHVCDIECVCVSVSV
jgi:hypothetical protein